MMVSAYIASTSNNNEQYLTECVETRDNVQIAAQQSELGKEIL